MSIRKKLRLRRRNDKKLKAFQKRTLLYTGKADTNGGSFDTLVSQASKVFREFLNGSATPSRLNDALVSLKPYYNATVRKEILFGTGLLDAVIFAVMQGTYDKKDPLPSNALWYLVNASASSSRDTVDYLVDRGVPKALMDVITTNRFGTKNTILAMAVVGNIAKTSKRYRVQLLELNAVGTLLDMLLGAGSASKDFIIEMTRCVGQIIESSVRLVAARDIGRLIDLCTVLISYKDAEISLNASWILIYLSRSSKSEINRMIFNSNGLIEGILKDLEAAEIQSDLIRNFLSLIGNLLTEEPIANALINRGILPIIHGLLSKGRLYAVRCIWILTGLCEFGDAIISKVIARRGLLNMIKEMLGNPPQISSIATEILFLFSAIYSLGEETVVFDYLFPEYFEYSGLYLRESKTSDLILQILDSYQKILRFNLKFGGEYEHINAYVDMISEQREEITNLIKMKDLNIEQEAINTLGALDFPDLEY